MNSIYPVNQRGDNFKTISLRSFRNGKWAVLAPGETVKQTDFAGSERLLAETIHRDLRPGRSIRIERLASLKKPSAEGRYRR
jgi:hypothetical protein